MRLRRSDLNVFELQRLASSPANSGLASDWLPNGVRHCTVGVGVKIEKSETLAFIRGIWELVSHSVICYASVGFHHRLKCSTVRSKGNSDRFRSTCGHWTEHRKLSTIHSGRSCPCTTIMSFTNVYYKRTAATAKACYVCYRPTTTVLATVNTVDFIYACPGHLTDHNFATRIVDESGPVKGSVSPEEIAKIKQEWEEKQKKKQEKEKEEEKAKEDDKKDKKKDEAGSKEGSKSPKPPGALSPASGPSTPAATAPKHERYSLHRDFYAS
ncbi:hypothetical protein D9611_002246 [Ephemerocybe angulata]|uniref:DUF1742-domain-containing protein n=1 Tax=Ephemerocybe angulata TaxID=980116 RepID=A0A8H5C1R9_9AGAR|nr:hypothetical protein D9611_002246 [Tulosesus angulatus]